MQIPKSSAQAVMAQLKRIETFLRSDTANADLLATAIDLSLELELLERAQELLDQALSHYPDNIYFQARKGNLLLAQKNWPAAQALFSELNERHPDVELAYSLAVALVWLRRHQDAVDVMAPYIALSDLPIQAVTLLVRAWHHIGQFETALAFVEQHFARCKSDMQFLSAASLLYLDCEQFDKARELSETVLATDTGSVEALVSAGTIALLNTDQQAAIEYFQRGLALNATQGRCWAGLGLSSLLSHNFAAADEQLQQALQYFPEHVGTLHALGWCKILSQDASAAKAIFEQAIALDRNFSESHGGLAVVYALSGQEAPAQESIRRAFALDRQCLSARYAQMVLDGTVHDAVRFRQMAFKFLSARQGMSGQKLVDTLKKFEQVSDAD